MFRIICLIIGYFIGCIQSSYLIGRIFYKIDIREHGSGNAGSTNTVRTLGAKAGLLVFALDIIKAAVAYMLASALFKSQSVFFADSSGLSVLPGLYCGFGAILGHNFPFYLKFKGGKGVASTIGTILFMDVWVSWVCYLLAIGLVAVTRYISVASLTLTLLFPVLMLIADYPAEAVIVGFVIGALGWFQHRGNIVRLVKGEERKFNFRKEKQNE